MRRLIFFIILLGSGFLLARDLSLEEAEKLALKNNLQIKISETSLQRAKASGKEALANFFPTISSFYQLTDNLELSVVYIDFDGDGPAPPTEMRMGKQFNSTLGLQLSYPIFTGGAIINGQLMANASVNLSELSMQEQVNTVIHTIRSLYYQVQMLESMIAANETALESAGENYELAQIREETGTATRLDVLQAKVRYESYKPQLISLKNQRVNALNNLKTYINDPDLEEINITGGLEQIPNPYSGIPPEELISLGRENRPELQMAEQQKKISAYQRSIAYSHILPKVQLGSTVQWQGNADAIDELNHRRNSNISVSVSLPLFSGGKNAVGIQKAGIALREANYQYEQAVNYIENDVDAAYRSVEEAYSNILATADVVDQAEEALRLSKLLYETGSATQADLLTSESAYLTSQSNYISSVFQYNIAVESLKKALNNIITNERSQ
jgi:outer membrane protein